MKGGWKSGWRAAGTVGVGGPAAAVRVRQSRRPACPSRRPSIPRGQEVGRLHAQEPGQPEQGPQGGAADAELQQTKVRSRSVVLPERSDDWSVTSVHPRLVKTGGRLVKHARYCWLMLAESHLTRRLFGSMVRRIAALAVPTG